MVDLQAEVERLAALVEQLTRTVGGLAQTRGPAARGAVATETVVRDSLVTVTTATTVVVSADYDRILLRLSSPVSGAGIIWVATRTPLATNTGFPVQPTVPLEMKFSEGAGECCQQWNALVGISTQVLFVQQVLIKRY